MSSKFGFLAKFDFLQNCASALIGRVPPEIIHNLGKYAAIKKVHYLSSIEEVEGDYLEFGVFRGSSFCHSIRCYQILKRNNPKIKETKFYGFDSFEGFGTLSAIDEHPFYKDENFETDLNYVNRRVKRVAKLTTSYQLIPGFFSNSLKQKPKELGITRVRIIFIDSDTYSSAYDIFVFCSSIIQEGCFVILDDFYSYKGSLEKGVAKAFFEFVESNRLTVRQIFTYGMGGCVYLISKYEKKNIVK